MTRLFALLLLGLLAMGTGLLAQVDQRLWDSVATRAERAVDGRSDDSAVYENLRERITGFRAEFDVARQQNADRIATLRQQIDALGAASDPESTDPEAPDVTARRAELESQLSSLLAPVQVADAAYRRADGLVGEIDQILRERQTTELFSLGPTPLNPAHWPVALTEGSAAVSHIFVTREVIQNLPNRAQTQQDMPLVILAALAGFVLILRGRKWSKRITKSLSQFGARGFGIWRFVVSLLRIIFPFVGLCLISFAAIGTGVFGAIGTELWMVLPVLGGLVLGIRWVSDRLFSRDEDEALILLPTDRRTAARFNVGAITILLILDVVLALVLEQPAVSVATKAVLAFPVTVLTGVFLFRLGQILRGYLDDAPSPMEESETRASGARRLIRGLGFGAMAVAFIAVAMAAIGYGNAAAGAMGPYTISLVLLGLVMVLQRFAADVYGAITGQGEQAREALIPVLIGFLLTLAAVPFLALAWGARLSDLTEIWTTFRQGFALGETRISPTDFLTFVVVFAIGYMVTRLVQGALRSSVLPKTRIDIGGQNAIVSGLGYVGIFVAALIAITTAGIDLSSLAIVAGALSVGIGFGLQNIVSNFVSGIILLIERPISEGDWIEVGGKTGYVRDISVRSTRIETFDRTDVIVPNADLVSGTVTNFTRGNTVGRLIVSVGVAYGTDTQKVDAILREIAEAQPLVLMNPAPTIVFIGFGADSLDFQIRMILRDVNYMMSVQNDVNHAIAARFTAEGIEMPFAQRDIWLRNPEALQTKEPT